MPSRADIPFSYSSGKRWFVFYAETAREMVAGAKISELGIETYVPVEKRIQRRPNAKARHVEMALFSHYGFARFDIDLDDWGGISTCDGVVDLLRMGQVPVSIPNSKIDELKLAERMGLFDRTKPPKAGMMVEATAGPFSGWIGRVAKARAADRAKVIFEMFGSQREVEMPLSMLREA